MESMKTTNSSSATESSANFDGKDKDDIDLNDLELFYYQEDKTPSYITKAQDYLKRVRQEKADEEAVEKDSMLIPTGGIIEISTDKKIRDSLKVPIKFDGYQRFKVEQYFNKDGEAFVELRPIAEDDKIIQDQGRFYLKQDLMEIPTDSRIVYIREAKQEAEIEAESAGAEAEEVAQKKEKRRLSDDEWAIATEAAKFTLMNVPEYSADEKHPLWAETEEEGDEVFKKATRELWARGVVVHYQGSADKKKHYPDLDGKCALGILKQAGINIKDKDIHFAAPGKYVEGMANMDTGAIEGVKVAVNPKTGEATLIIDHHGEGSPADTSAAAKTYEVMKLMGLIESDEVMNRLVDFVNQADNKIYERAKDNFNNSYKTMLGLSRYSQFDKLLQFFRDGKRPNEILDDNDLAKYGLMEGSKKQLESIKKDKEVLTKMKGDGRIIDSKKFGKILIDVGKKLESMDDAAVSEGCDSYVLWNPDTTSVFLSTTKTIPEGFTLPQGVNIRNKMWVMPSNGIEPLQISLSELIDSIAGPDFKPVGKLKEYLDAEKNIGKSFEAGGVWTPTGHNSRVFLEIAGSSADGMFTNGSGLIGQDYKIVRAFSEGARDKVTVSVKDKGETFLATYEASEFLRGMKPKAVLGVKDQEDRHLIARMYEQWVERKLSTPDKAAPIKPEETIEQEKPEEVISPEPAPVPEPKPAPTEVPTVDISPAPAPEPVPAPTQVKVEDERPEEESVSIIKEVEIPEEPFNTIRIVPPRNKKAEPKEVSEKEMPFQLEINLKGKKTVLEEGKKIIWKSGTEKRSLVVERMVPRPDGQVEIKFADIDAETMSVEDWKAKLEKLGDENA